MQTINSERKMQPKSTPSPSQRILFSNADETRPLESIQPLSTTRFDRTKRHVKVRTIAIVSSSRLVQNFLETSFELRVSTSFSLSHFFIGSKTRNDEMLRPGLVSSCTGERGGRETN